jgi:hypothetical protein
VMTLLLGGLCLYSTLFSTLLRDLLLGRDFDRTMSQNFNTVIAWGIAFTVAIMILSVIFLALYGIEGAYRRVHRRPAICERCGLMEVRKILRFAHEPVKDTDWEIVTCPKCGHEWHVKR